jgi:hypothetical protein
MLMSDQSDKKKSLTNQVGSSAYAGTLSFVNCGEAATFAGTCAASVLTGSCDPAAGMAGSFGAASACNSANSFSTSR